MYETDFYIFANVPVFGFSVNQTQSTGQSYPTNSLSGIINFIIPLILILLLLWLFKKISE